MREVLLRGRRGEVGEHRREDGVLGSGGAGRTEPFVPKVFTETLPLVPYKTSTLPLPGMPPPTPR